MTRKSLTIGTAVALALAAGAVAYGTFAAAQPYGGWGMMGGYGHGTMHGPGYGPGWMHGDRGYDRDDRRAYGPRFGRGFMHRGYGPGYGPGAPRNYDPNIN